MVLQHITTRSLVVASRLARCPLHTACPLTHNRTTEQDGGGAAWVDPAWTEVLGGAVGEANAAAKRAVEQALREHDGIELAKQEDASNGELPSGHRL